MKNFTDIFIRRPVLATVISVAILVLGVRALAQLPTRQYPETTNAVVTVSTAYFGADADTVAGFITSPLEQSISQANGIDYMSSSSRLGFSTITINLKLNYDSNRALTEITSYVNAVKNQLPAESQTPVITVAVGESIDVMYMSFFSPVLPGNKITDYLQRIVQPQLQAIEGVQQVEMIGAKKFAVRVWLDPNKLTANGLTASDVSAALGTNDFLSTVGRTQGQMVQVNLNASTNLKSLDEFRNLVIRSKNGAFTRLQDVANVTMGADDYDTLASFDGKDAVHLGIKVAPSANVLDVIGRVREAFPAIQKQLPEGLNGYIAYDATRFIQSSINEVIYTLIQAVLIIILVVFIFLGSPRAVLIPVLAIPLSLVGAGIFMLAMGFTINLLTLLALVLAIGLVVDDAIIVVENVSRHLEEGRTPFDAALIAARELGTPIIAMGAVLVAVYVPIGFVGGITGTLFAEFAFTLVAAIVVSTIVALTLSPMLSSQILRSHANTPDGWEKRLTKTIDQSFEWMRHRYERALHLSLNNRPVTFTFGVLVLLSLFALFQFSTSELAPSEDQGFVIAQVINAPNATTDQALINHRAAYKVFQTIPEVDHVFQVISPGFSIAGAALKPWDERTRTATQVQQELQTKLSKIPSAQIAAFEIPPLPGPGFGVQFVIETTESFPQLQAVTQRIMADAQAAGLFYFLDADLKIDQPQQTIVIDRDKVASFGLTMRDVGSAMGSMLGGGYVNYFSLAGRAYRVIPQVTQQERLNPDQLKNYPIRTANGDTITLSTVAHLEDSVVPESLSHFQQLNSATITGGSAMPVGQLVQKMQEIAAKEMPAGYRLDYSGSTRQYVQESNALVLTFVLAIVIIYLTLSALFESFRDPIIILVSVPLSIFGAMLFIVTGMGGASLNIYTEVGLVTLIGLISKHGILMVQFANDLRHGGMEKRAAIEHAAAIRLRPILMTTAAMVLGVIPLLIASGAGAASRYNLGLVIASGISVGTCFTLFVLPAVYLLISPKVLRVHHDEGTI